MDLVEIQNDALNLKDRHPWELARLEVVFVLVQQIFPNLNKHKYRILDIGCGDTFLIDRLSERIPQAEFVAVDIAFTPEIISQLREKYQSRPIYVYDSLEGAQAENPASADLVLLLDVIEHIKDDIGFLNHLGQQKLVGNNTVFLVTAPAFQSMFTQHDVYLKHYRRYNNSQLKRCLAKAGLNVQRAGYFFSLLLFPRLLKCFTERAALSGLKQEKGGGAWKSKGFLDKIIKETLFF